VDVKCSIIIINDPISWVSSKCSSKIVTYAKAAFINAFDPSKSNKSKIVSDNLLWNVKQQTSH
jgi:hypothetical protein